MGWGSRHIRHAALLPFPLPRATPPILPALHLSQSEPRPAAVPGRGGRRWAGPWTRAGEPTSKPRLLLPTGLLPSQSGACCTRLPLTLPRYPPRPQPTRARPEETDQSGHRESCGRRRRRRWRRWQEIRSHRSGRSDVLHQEVRD